MLVFLFLFFAVTCNAQNLPKCNDNSVPETTLIPSPDGTESRYTVKWCPRADYFTGKRKIADSSEWELLMLYDNRTQENCKETTLYREPRIRHSKAVVPLELDHNCSNVCFYKEIDLIITGCYFIKNMLVWSQHRSEFDETYHYVSNNIKSVDHFIKNIPLVWSQSYGNEVQLKWYFGYLPVSEYAVNFCKNDTVEECVPVENCTSAEPHVVACSVRAAAGCYRASLAHRAAWTHAALWQLLRANYYITLCHPEAREGGDGGDSAAAAEAAGAWGRWAWWALAGAGAAAGGALLLRRLRARPHKDSVLKAWLMGRRPAAAPHRECGDVLVVYAREGGPAPRMLRALLAVLRAATNGKVYDLHSPQTAALSAGAGVEWLRGALARPGTRVVILQTPAAMCLYSHLAPTDVGLKERNSSAPEGWLLASGAVYRRPAASDALAAAALRLARDSALSGDVYNKYYVAQILSLETEVVPQVSPFRRYLLPDGVGVLLQDLAPDHDPSDTSALVAELHEATNDFLQYVRENENYLRDELFFL